jgi:hypothetical protein
MIESVFDLLDDAACSLTRKRETDNRFSPKGCWLVEHVRDGKVVGHYEFPNDITNVGKNAIFNTFFFDATQIASSSWFAGLISSASYSALAAGDTMSSHSGWTELTGYTQSTRPAWGQGSAASQSMTNATPITFDINASGTVKGIFITSNSIKGGTTGTLWATALFAADVPVSNGDQLKATYTVSA